MSGKSIKEILEKIENDRIERIRNNEEEERRLNSIREKSRKEYLERNRIYENALYNTTTNMASAGGRAKGNKKVKSYITTDMSYLYPVVNLNSALSDPSLYEERIGNTILFNNIEQLYDFYSTVYTNSVSSNGGNAYSVGLGTQLKDMESDNIIMRLSDVNDTKVIEWKLVKQLTSQSELDPSYQGNSPDGTVGYVTIYSDWDKNGQIDIDINDIYSYFASEEISGESNIDIATLTEGPLVDVDE